MDDNTQEQRPPRESVLSMACTHEEAQAIRRAAQDFKMPTSWLIREAVFRTIAEERKLRGR